MRGRLHLLSVVDLPDEGLPTRPIKGSRGIMRAYGMNVSERAAQIVESSLGTLKVA